MRKQIISAFFLGATAILSAQDSVISGEVFDKNDKPQAGINVSCSCEPKNSILTQKDGHFEFRNLENGNYTLKISKNGKYIAEKYVSVSNDEIVDVHFNLNEKDIEEVVINANVTKHINKSIATVGKAGLLNMDNPQGITTIDKNIIKNQQAQNLSDVLRNVSGVYTTSIRGGFAPSLGARGYMFGSDNIFRNGVRVPMATNYDVNSLERVEMLKGSAAILFGQVAPGGVVNMVSKLPKFTTGGSVSLDAGSFGLFNTAIDFHTPLSKYVAVRLNTSYRRADSFRDDVSSSSHYINPSILIKPSKGSEIILEADYLDNKLTPDFGIGGVTEHSGSGGRLATEIPINTFFGLKGQYNDTKQSNSTLTYNQKFNDHWKLNTVLSYTNRSRDYQSGERVAWIKNPLNNEYEYNRPIGKLYEEQNYASGQINLTGEFKVADIKNQILVGADADFNRNNNYAFASTTVGVLSLSKPATWLTDSKLPNNAQDVATFTDTKRLGAYAQDLISIGKYVKVLAGLRWSLVELPTVNEVKDFTKSSDRTERAGSSTLVYRQFNPKGGIVIQPIKELSIFGSYANNFVVNTGTDVDRNPLKPSIVDQIEAGFKTNLLNEKLSFNVTAYQINNNNLAQMVEFDPLLNTINTNANIKELVGETRSKGFEVDVQGTPIPYLVINAGYSYNDMRYTKTNNSADGFIVGERLVRTPASTASLSAHYTFKSIQAIEGLMIGAGLFYTGNRYFGWNNQNKNLFPQNYASVVDKRAYSRISPMGGYSTIDFTLGYKTDRFSIQAKLANALNVKDYTVHENYSVNPITPRNYQVNLTYNF